MQVSNVSSFLGVADPQATKSVLPQQTLGQEQFLKLLMAQLSNQDPLAPVSNTEFVGQMAQFTSLSQSAQMTQSLQRIEGGAQWQGASALLGREVTLTDGSRGVVKEVNLVDGDLWLNLGDKSVTMDEVISFREPASRGAVALHASGTAGRGLPGLPSGAPPSQLK